MVDNLFVGNKLSTARIVTERRHPARHPQHQVADHLFLLEGDNITPPQQALDWILDNYDSVDEIRVQGQTILYCLHQKAGHLAIFVSTKVAAEGNSEFINYMDLIDAMPPGLYEIVISQKPRGAAAGGRLRPEDRGVAASTISARWAAIHQRMSGSSTAVARVSEVNNTLYETFVQPWIKAMIGPHLARAARELHPLRLRYAALSDKGIR